MNRIFCLFLALLPIYLPGVFLLGQDRPNFIFFITDDISADDLGCYGNPVVQTPHLDRIAAEGRVFDRAYLTTSSCSPSRCSIITGRYPHNTGAPELHTHLPDDQVTFVQKLQAAGYYTVISGKNHMNEPEILGFDEKGEGGKPSGSRDWVRLLRNRPLDRPFFCWFASNDAHRDWQINERAPQYDPDDMQVPAFLFDGPRTRKDLAEYYHEVSRTDTYVGELVAELIRQGIAGNTYLVYCSDNGRPFPRCKTRLYDSGVKTPLIIWNPGKIKPGRTRALASSIDFAPTILELAGLEAGPTFQGVSLAPVLENPHGKVRDFAFSEHNWHVYAAHERSVRYGQWLYIRNAYPNKRNLSADLFKMLYFRCAFRNAYPNKRNLSVESNDSKFPAALELWDRYEAGETLPHQEDIPLVPRPQTELFHVNADPHQLVNLSGRARYEAIEKKLASVLERWAVETGDNVPENPTPDRAKGPRPRKDVRGEMPGQATGADKINRAGPVLEG